MTKKEKPGNPPNWKHVDRNGKMLEWCVFLEGIYDECNWGTLISLRKLCRKQFDIELTVILFFKHPIAEATLWDLASPSPLALIPGDWPRWHHFMEKVSPKTPNWEKRHTFCWYPCVNDIGINPIWVKGVACWGPTCDPNTYDHSFRTELTIHGCWTWILSQIWRAPHEILDANFKISLFFFLFPFCLTFYKLWRYRYRWFSSILSTCQRWNFASASTLLPSNKRSKSSCQRSSNAAHSAALKTLVTSAVEFSMSHGGRWWASLVHIFKIWSRSDLSFCRIFLRYAYYVYYINVHDI